MIEQTPVTLDQIYGGNFKKVQLTFEEMEGTTPFLINESDEDKCSDGEIYPKPQKQIPQAIKQVRLRPIVEVRKRRSTLHKSPVIQTQFEKHIGFRNSFYKNNKVNISSKHRVDQIQHLEIEMFSRYAQKFNLSKIL